MLADTMRRVNESKNVGALMRAAAELEYQTKERRERTAQYSRTAWAIDIALFSLAGVLLCGGLWVRFIGERDVLPKSVYGVFERLFQPGGVLGNPIVWAVVVIGLLILPLVPDRVLAKRSRPTTRMPERPAGAYKFEKGLPSELRFVEHSLSMAMHELRLANPECGERAMSVGFILCFLFPIVLLRVLIVYAHKVNLVSGFLESLVWLAIGGVVLLALFGLIMYIHDAAMCRAFSNKEEARQAEQLCDEFIKAAKQLYPGYLSWDEEKRKQEAEEAQRKLELKKKWEQYNKEHPVIVDYRDIQARLDRNARAEGSSLTSYDHDDLDAVSRTLDRDYGGSWLDDM